MEKNQEKLIQLGKKIRALRKNRGLSQKLLAYNVSIDERWLRNIEKGIANPSLNLLLNIADQLNISISELLED